MLAIKLLKASWPARGAVEEVEVVVTGVVAVPVVAVLLKVGGNVPSPNLSIFHNSIHRICTT